MNSKRQALIDELQLAAQKITDMTMSADTKIFITNSEWTIADTLAHLIVTQQILTSLLTNKKNQFIQNTDNFIEEVSQKLSRDFIAQLNKKFLSKFSQRNGTILSKSFTDEISLFVKESKKYPDDKIFKTHYGEMNLLELYAYCLMHLMIHGSAVAKTLNQSLPITKKGSLLVLPFTKIVMLKLFDKKKAKNFTATIVISLRGTENFAVVCNKGKIIIQNKIPRQIDATIFADPLVFFLVSTGITSKWKPIFIGKLFVFGKNPLKAFQLQTFFQGL